LITFEQVGADEAGHADDEEILVVGRHASVLLRLGGYNHSIAGWFVLGSAVGPAHQLSVTVS
jgi:hypothetical protein